MEKSNGIKDSGSRYLLLVDVLGFRKSVQDEAVEAVYQRINASLRSLHTLEAGTRGFATLSFSDTLILWQQLEAPSVWTFGQLWIVGTRLFSALLAKGVPVRGAISFGDFTVRRDSDNRHDVFFGKALIEAYDAERSESWLGIVVCPSAWKRYEVENPGLIDVLDEFGRWRRRGENGPLLLNPFPEIMSTWPGRQALPLFSPGSGTDEEARVAELKAFRFICEEAEKFAREGDFSGAIAIKYHTTVTFLREVMGPGCFRWAHEESTRLQREGPPG
jgi:hypothetical protein